MDTVSRHILLYVLPFATWIGLQSLLPATAACYALRSALTAIVGAGCFAAARRIARAPHRADPFSLATLFPGVAIGLVVAAVWILPEKSTLYRTWCCWPLGTPAAPPDASPYDPAVCGTLLTCAKLLGSAFVIAPVEEVFFRSFLYRWLQQRDFMNVSPRHFDLSAFCWMILLFTLEHDRPLVAAFAGAVYGLTYIRLGLAAAIAAHVTTNFALGRYVIGCGAWAFW